MLSTKINIANMMLEVECLTELYISHASPTSETKLRLCIL